MAQPKIWESLLLYDSRNVRCIYFQMPTDHEPGSLDWTNVFVDFRRNFFSMGRGALSAEVLPLFSFWRYKDEPRKKRNNLPDAFTAQMGIPMVSGRMKAVLERFDLGDTSFYPIKLYEFDQVTQRPDDLYIWDVRNAVRALVPEKSKGILDLRGHGTTWDMFPEKGKFLALDEACIPDVDVWIDPQIGRRLFFSDRLRTALRQADLSLRCFGWRACKLVAR